MPLMVYLCIAPSFIYVLHSYVKFFVIFIHYLLNTLSLCEVKFMLHGNKLYNIS